jgi:nucleoside-diphosphate-sugar epimerase
MRVVITGATGNVGTSLVRSFAMHGEVSEIIGIARRRPGRRVPKTDWITADVASDDLLPHFTGADVVIHLAWAIQPSRDEATLRAINVDGSRRVFEAVASAGVPALVYASSVGAYSPGPKDRAVDESWPIDGIGSSFYARHKAEVERLLDRFEHKHPGVRTARLRPGLIFKRGAASEQRRLFGGPLFPTFLLRPDLIPFVPDLPRLRFQAVHTDDVARAYCEAALGDARGPFNIAAEPVLDSNRLAKLLGARKLPTPPRLLRGLAAATWRMRLQPTPEGWVDMALAVPIMDTRRAREELGWQPQRSAEDALLELLDGMHEGAGIETPPLVAGGAGPLRIREFLTGIGGRNP